MATPLPSSDHAISLDDATQIVTARRNADAGRNDAEHVFAFHRLGLDKVLAEPGCVGIRAYPAQHPDGSHSWVLVGVDQNGNDMTGGALVQEPFLCPPYCPDVLLGSSGG